MGVVALVGACGPAGDDGRPVRPDVDTDGTVEDTDPVDTDLLDTDAPTPPDPLDAATVSAIVAAGERFAAEVAALDFPPVDAAVAVMRTREELPVCPELHDVHLGPGWRADCLTSEGTRFFGTFVTMIYLWDEYLIDLGAGILGAWGALVEPGWVMPDPLPVPTVTGYTAICSADRAGNAITFSGLYHDLRVDLAGLVVEELRIDGAVTDPAQVDTWIARGLVPNLTRTTLTGSGGRGVTVIHGAITGLPTELDTVWVADLSVGNAAMGDPCPAEPSGMFAVRDPGGDWYDLVFDGDDGGSCDGCAGIVRAGAAVGTACLDLGPLLHLTDASDP